MVRATAIFLVIGSVLAAASFLARTVLHLQCFGPDLPGMSCAAQPYPDALPATQPVLLWLGIAAAVWIASYLIRNLVFNSAAWVISKIFPGYLDQFTTHPPVPSDYRLR